MTTIQNLRQANAFAMVDALKFAVLWCIAFYCTFKGYGNPTLSMIGFCCTIGVPVVGGVLAYRFEKQVREDGPVGYGKAYMYSVMLYLFASILMTLFSFAYFQWMEPGSFASTEIEVLSSPEAQKAFNGVDIFQALNSMARQEGFKSYEDYLHSISAIDIAATIFNMNFFLSIFLALPTALFGKSRR